MRPSLTIIRHKYSQDPVNVGGVACIKVTSWPAFLITSSVHAMLGVLKVQKMVYNNSRKTSRMSLMPFAEQDSEIQ